jgi:hypothetical protein
MLSFNISYWDLIWFRAHLMFADTTGRGDRAWKPGPKTGWREGDFPYNSINIYTSRKLGAESVTLNPQEQDQVSWSVWESKNLRISLINVSHTCYKIWFHQLWFANPWSLSKWTCDPSYYHMGQCVGTLLNTSPQACSSYILSLLI